MLPGRWLALAESRSRPIVFHDFSGAVTLVVSTHLALSLRKVCAQETALVCVPRVISVRT